MDGTTVTDEDCGCETEGSKTQGSVLVNDVRVSGRSLRATELADANGKRVRVSDLVGEDGKSVVIFLRHLG